jgi:hypothetical protein
VAVILSLYMGEDHPNTVSSANDLADDLRALGEADDPEAAIHITVIMRRAGAESGRSAVRPALAA